MSGEETPCNEGEGSYFWEEEVTMPQEKRTITKTRRAIHEPRPTLLGTMFSVISLTLHQRDRQTQKNGTDNKTVYLPKISPPPLPVAKHAIHSGIGPALTILGIQCFIVKRTGIIDNGSWTSLGAGTEPVKNDSTLFSG